MGRPVVDTSVSVGCWSCLFRTKGFASSAAHRPADLEKCLLQKGWKASTFVFVASSV